MYAGEFIAALVLGVVLVFRPLDAPLALAAVPLLVSALGGSYARYRRLCRI
ncbi:hypothetical protein [Streptomyces sp. NPDC059009]|uniref:hypothetical protein n=1 Tax=Streptomyces sp. NPDC059009 TaxID=3346694 RepID=UPI00368489DA